jgi:hypothetical protein
MQATDDPRTLGDINMHIRRRFPFVPDAMKLQYVENIRANLTRTKECSLLYRTFYERIAGCLTEDYTKLCVDGFKNPFRE